MINNFSYYHDLTEGTHLHDILKLFIHISQCKYTFKWKQKDYKRRLLEFIQFSGISGENPTSKKNNKMQKGNETENGNLDLSQY